MAQTTGTVDTFANTEINDEILDTGDGIQTVFSMQLTKVPVFLTPFTIEYVIGASTFQGTSDANGDITGTNITSGTIDEAGAVNVTFSTAPDDTIDITSPDYRTKGFLEKLLDFVRGTKAEETIGTGDGIDTTFPFALANTPLAEGQVRVEFKIGTNVYKVWDNGADSWDHDEIDLGASSINYGAGTGTLETINPVDDLFDVKIFYAAASVAGQDWLLLTEQDTKENDNSTDAFPGELLKETLLKNSGSTFNESVIIGFREFKRIVTGLYGINLKTHFNLNENSDWSDNNVFFDYDGTTNNYTRLPNLSLNDDTMVYWIMSSKNRIMGAIKIGSVYTEFYVGAGFRFSAPSKYPNPLIAAGPTYGNIIWSDTGNTHRYFIDQVGVYAIHIVNRDDLILALNMRILPLYQWVNTGILTDIHGGGIVLKPCYVYNQPGDEVLFELEGVFWCPKDNLNSEDTATIGPDTYLIFQNIFRTSYNEFLALKQE